MKNKTKMIMIMLLLVILVLLMLCSNDLLKLKQLLVFGLEQFTSANNTENTNMKMELPIHAKNTTSEKGHPGYCFIGDTDGTRHCVELEPDDKCVSGQIYSSKEVCVNPELRN